MDHKAYLPSFKIEVRLYIFEGCADSHALCQCEEGSEPFGEAYEDLLGLRLIEAEDLVTVLLPRTDLDLHCLQGHLVTGQQGYS